MFDYNALSPNRRQFIDLARQVFPDLADNISSKQIDAIVAKTGISYPQWFIVQENRASRGIYYIPSVVTGDQANKKPDETDEEISVRIKETYQAMNDMVRAVAANAVNSLVIAGGAGLGKSYGVNETLNKLYGDYGYVFHRGYIKGSHLFRLLWENRHPGQVIVLDDVDIWNDEQVLNLLKAALELKTTRRIGWGSEKEFEDQDGEVIPRYFDYEGSIIFLTNLKIREMIENGTKNSPHLAAIESRSLVMDMKIKTKREYLIAIKQKVYEEDMLAKQGFSATEVAEIMEFFEQNFDKFTEYSLRMIEKVARIYRAVPDWKVGVKNFCFR
jgi:hypothetical protein